MRTGLRFSCSHIVLACIALSIADRAVLAQNGYSCGNGDWFAVQEAQVKGERLSSLCQGELDAAADRRGVAERELKAVIEQAPEGADAYEAHSSLSHFYLRIGRFHDAEAQILAMLAAKPKATDLANVRSLFALLGDYPDLEVSSSYPASIHSQTIDGNVFMPVVVNGLARNYMLDTGLNLSLMSELEAARLGLTPQSSTTRLSDISGLNGPELRIVEIKNLVIGATHLSNVPFLIVADTNGAFVGIPKDQHAILGIQPLLALGTLSFHTDGTLRVADKAEPSVTTAPLLFEGELPLTQINYKSHPLTVTFDMGATQTTIDPPFAKLYPELLQGGSSDSHTLNGLSGTTAQRSVSLPNLVFRFGREVHLMPAVILLDQTTGASEWVVANLGYDLMQQVRPFTLNFRRMEIEFPKTN
ncbi:MAG: retropepsin-like aspartic protease [Terracidiphilus sp.]